MKKPKKPKPKQKRSTQAPPQKPIELPEPKRLHLFTRVKWAAIFVAGVLGLVASIVAIWGPVWPTKPSIDVGPPSSEGPFSVSFQVTNASVLFPLQHLTLLCGIYYIHTDHHQSMEGGFSLTAGGDNTLPPGESRPYKCESILNFGGARIIGERITIRGTYDLPVFGHFKFESAAFNWDSNSNPPRWVRGDPLK